MHMAYDWLTPTLIGGGGISLAGFGTWAVGHFSRTFRRVVGEIVTTIIGGVIADLKSDLEVRFDHNDEQTKVAADKADLVKLEMARQFGGNGGGLRQAINELTRDVAYLKGALGVAPEVTAK